MRIIAGWQYKYIEKCLYNYNNLAKSPLPTEKKMAQAITLAQEFFGGSTHEQMMEHFYFDAEMQRKKRTNAQHYAWVCEEVLHTEVPNGYVIRREIVYRVAMNCYALNLFQLVS